MHIFITTFLFLINLMISKCTSYIIVLQCWNTAVCKHPIERENGCHCKNVYRSLA
jgi:hypothetical protein